MKCAFQLLFRGDGSRSEPFVFARDDFAKELHARYSLEEPVTVDNYFVLVLCEFSTRGSDAPEWNFSNAPLMTVRRYVELFGAGLSFPEQPVNFPSNAEGDNAGSDACL